MRGRGGDGCGGFLRHPKMESILKAVCQQGPVMNASRPVRRTVHYAGHVQGVGFRFTAATIAQSYPVQGFVQNLPDGRVLLVAEGAAADVTAFMDDIAGRMSRFIREALVDNGPATGEFSVFEVRS